MGGLQVPAGLEGRREIAQIFPLTDGTAHPAMRSVILPSDLTVPVEGNAMSVTPDHEAVSGTSDGGHAAHDMNGVVLQLHRAVRGTERISLGELVDAMGPSSMSAVLLVPALLLLSPLSGIPGASIVGGLVIALVSAQIVVGREKVWLPEFVRKRTLPGPKLQRALVWLRKPARKFDGLVQARPEGADHAWWAPAVAVLCLGLGLAMPMLELIPFTSSIVAGLVALLALSMLTGRARLAVAAIVLASIGIGGAVWAL
jgi:hypothetical protein